MKFEPCPQPTVGVEWELQLLDPETLDLSNGIVPLMEFFPEAIHVKPELIQACVELNSCVADNSDTAVEDLALCLDGLLKRCTELEMSVCGAGTHPFCRRLALITPIPRYRAMEKESGYLAHTQITFSTHVHIGMESGDFAMQVMNRLVPAVPLLMALSANSPFWRGHDTGHAAYRHRILAAAPNYGLPSRFADWAEYSAFLTAASRAGMIENFKGIHWDIRPHPDFGTLEIRAMDAASDLPTLHGLVAFARCLALRLADASRAEIAEVLPLELPDWIEKQNRFAASLRGLDADFILDEVGRRRSVRDVLGDLMDFCVPIASRIGETAGLQAASALLAEVPAYERQRRVYAQANSARSIVAMLQDVLIDGSNGADSQ